MPILQTLKRPNAYIFCRFSQNIPARHKHIDKSEAPRTSSGPCVAYKSDFWRNIKINKPMVSKITAI